MKLYYCDIKELSDLPAVELLPPERRQRMERFKSPGDKARCLAAGLLLHAVLGESAARVEKGEYGKPFIAGGPHFSLSHSGSFVTLGVSERRTGVDIQSVKPWRERVARRCYTAEELQWLFSQQEQSAFYKLWTAKESVMKGCGLGLSMDPASFSVLPAADGAHIIKGQEWFLRWLSLPGYELCAACASPFEKPALLLLSREELLR